MVCSASGGNPYGKGLTDHCKLAFWLPSLYGLTQCMVGHSIIARETQKIPVCLGLCKLVHYQICKYVCL